MTGTQSGVAHFAHLGRHGRRRVRHAPVAHEPHRAPRPALSVPFCNGHVRDPASSRRAERPRKGIRDRGAADRNNPPPPRHRRATRLSAQAREQAAQPSDAAILGRREAHAALKRSLQRALAHSELASEQDERSDGGSKTSAEIGPRAALVVCASALTAIAGATGGTVQRLRHADAGSGHPMACGCVARESGWCIVRGRWRRDCVRGIPRNPSVRARRRRRVDVCRLRYCGWSGARFFSPDRRVPGAAFAVLVAIRLRARPFGASGRLSFS